MKKFAIATILCMGLIAFKEVQAQVTNIVCSPKKGVDIPLTINFKNKTVTDIECHVAIATITDQKIIWFDGRNTNSIDRYTNLLKNGKNLPPWGCHPLARQF